MIQNLLGNQLSEVMDKDGWIDLSKISPDLIQIMMMKGMIDRDQQWDLSVAPPAIVL